MVHTLCQRTNGAFQRQATASWVQALREHESTVRHVGTRRQSDDRR